MEPIQISPTSMPRRKRAPALLIVLAALLGGFLIVGAAVFILVIAPYHRATVASNHLKNLLLAVHNFHEQNLALPNGVVYPRDPTTNQYDFQRRGRFSWRVQLLPFINQKPLYDRFNFGEPWDSEYNLSVAKDMPDIFRSRWDSQTTNHTGFVGIADPAGAFPTADRRSNGETPTRTFGDFSRDGMRTVAVVEVRNSGIIWTDPDGDISIDQFVKLVEQGKLDPPGQAEVGTTLLIGAMDGSVHQLPRNIPAKTARAMCTTNGGERITAADFAP